MSTDTHPTSLPIDRSLAVPPYFQLAEALRQKIRSGEFAPGDRLPSITELCAASNLSVATVVRGLAELSRAGEIITQRGSGTFVAEIDAQRATELLIHGGHPRPASYRSEFYAALCQGATVGFGDAERSIVLSYTLGHIPGLAELEGVMQARRSDSLIAYRPEGSLAETLGLLARRVPVSTLFYPAAGGTADAVVSAVDTTLQRMLQERVRQGHRSFFFIGFSEFEERGPREYSPYRLMRRAFTETMEDAGIEPKVHIGKGSVREGVEGATELVRSLPDGAVVVSHLALPGEDLPSGVEHVFYTEYWKTLEAQNSTKDVLYLGLERVAAAAAGQILDRLNGEVTGDGRILRLEPEIIEKGGALPDQAVKVSEGAQAAEVAGL